MEPAAAQGADEVQVQDDQRPAEEADLQVQAQHGDDIPSDELEKAVSELLLETPTHVTMRKFRRKLARHLGLDKNGLDRRAGEVTDLVKAKLAAKAEQPTPAQRMQGLISEVLGEESNPTRQCYVYLVTISRALPATQDATDLVDISGMTREQVGEAVRKAFDDPLPHTTAGGRPRTCADSLVRKVVCVRECYEDGDVHFHICVLLHKARGWSTAKRALREREHLAAHFSCTHTQWWSALRYCTTPTLRKPVVDELELVYSWSSDGSEIDLFAESQQPFNAGMWKRRMEQAEMQRSAGTGNKRRKFSKLDLTAIILTKNLKSKTEILEYTQDYGTEAMQNWVHNHQKLGSAHELSLVEYFSFSSRVFSICYIDKPQTHGNGFSFSS
jgi:hypothetical protein